MSTITYTKAEILLENVDFLVGELEKLNRKAKRLGLPLLQHFVEPSVRYAELEPGKVQSFVEVEIFGEIPRIDGWQLVARVEHNNDPAYPENVVVAAPGQTVPNYYRTASSDCNHCNHRRYRSNTYVLVNPEGELKQVGSSCLVDYIGKMTAKSLLYWYSFEKLIGDCIAKENGMRTRWSYDAREVIAMSLGCIDKFGWASRAMAEEQYVTSTASDVAIQMNQIARGNLSEKEKVYSAPWYEQAEAIMAWGASVDDTDNEYLHKVKTICSCKVVPESLFNLAVSIPQAWRKAMDLIEKKAARKPSEHIGEVGKKLKVTATCTGIWSFSSQWGVTEIIKFKTVEGDTVVWKTGSADVEEGKTYEIEGKVKEHGVFRDEKQTVITRAKYTEVK